MNMKKRKYGPRPKGGSKILTRLLDSHLEALASEKDRSGRTRTELIQRAIEAMYMGKRRKSDWVQPGA
jgi:hypothetical protein